MHLMAKGYSRDEAWAICRAQLNLIESLDIPIGCDNLESIASAFAAGRDSSAFARSQAQQGVPPAPGVTGGVTC